jgi:hypothetical protein
MDEERQTASSQTKTAEPRISTAADARRERLRLSQTVAGQVARFRAAGAAPSDDEAARLVAEFQARGGRVTVIPEVVDAPLKAPSTC